MVDTVDSKSTAPKAYRFKSDRRHKADPQGLLFYLSQEFLDKLFSFSFRSLVDSLNLFARYNGLEREGDHDDADEIDREAG